MKQLQKQPTPVTAVNLAISKQSMTTCGHQRIQIQRTVQHTTVMAVYFPRYPWDSQRCLVNIHKKYVVTTTTSLVLPPRKLCIHLPPNVDVFYYTVWSVLWINIQKSGHLDLFTLQVDTRSLTKFYQVDVHTRFVLNWPSFSVSQEAGLGHPKTEHLWYQNRLYTIGSSQMLNCLSSYQLYM